MEQDQNESIIVRSLLSQPIVLAILLNCGKYVMQLRDELPDINDPGRWGLFGGYRNMFETQHSAIKRELREELGLEFATGTIRYVFTYEWANVFSADISERYGEIVLGEGQAHGSFTLRELRKMNSAYHAVKILELYEQTAKNNPQ